VKYWEITANNLSKADWSWGCVSAVDSNGRAIFVADAHRDESKAFRCSRGWKVDRVCGTRIGDSELRRIGLTKLAWFFKTRRL